MKYFSNKKGFTLIELLVVIAIIAILTAIVTANFATSKAKARDAKRISDIAQIQLALEMVFDRCNVYPPDITNITTDICTGYPLNYFISKIEYLENPQYVWRVSFCDNANMKQIFNVCLMDMGGIGKTWIESPNEN